VVQLIRSRDVALSLRKCSHHVPYAWHYISN